MNLRFKRLPIAVFSIALAASLAANLLLYRRGRTYYLQLNGVRLDPLGLDEYPAGPQARPVLAAREKLVVFYGDSRAWEWPAPDTAGRFVFANRGVGAQTTAQVLGRFDAHLAPLQPDIVILQAGINDLKTVALFPGQRDRITARCREHLAEIIRRARAGGAVVIVTTVFPLGKVPPERRLFWSDAIPAAIDEVNTAITGLAGEGVIVFDAAAILAGEDGAVRRGYSRDLLHLSDPGYAALNEELARLLNELSP